MKRVFTLLCMILLLSSMIACSDSSEEEFYDFKGDLFSQGLVSVKSNENYLWGFVNSEGEEVIEPQYEQVTEFNDFGYSVVRIDDYEYNYIDVDGNEQLNQSFRYIEPFVGHSTVYIGANGYGILFDSAEIEAEGEYQLLKNSNYENRFIGIYRNYFHLIDESGDVITEDGYDDIEFFKDGASVTAVEEDRYFGVINSEGVEVVPIIYDEIYINAVNDTISVMKDDLYGLLDKDGEVLLDVEYRYEHIIYCGKDDLTAAFFSGPSNAGFIDLDGDVIIEPLDHLGKSDDLHSFQHGYQILMTEDSEYYIYDQEGKQQYQVATGDVRHCDGEVYIMRDYVSDKYVAYNKKGEVIIELDNEMYLTYDETDYILARSGDSMNIDIYNYEGEKVVSNTKFKAATFMMGMLMYYDEEVEKWGFMNSDCEIVIEPAYTMNNCYGYFYHDGYTIVEYGGALNIIDKAGNIILNSDYRGIQGWSPYN